MWTADVTRGTGHVKMFNLTVAPTTAPHGPALRHKGLGPVVCDPRLSDKARDVLGPYPNHESEF